VGEGNLTLAGCDSSQHAHRHVQRELHGEIVSRKISTANELRKGRGPRKNMESHLACEHAIPSRIKMNAQEQDA
jgi:hypothetical protein